MTDTQGNWIPPEESGTTDAAWFLVLKNIQYRLQENRTRREDAHNAITPAEARRRLVEGR